MRVSLALAAAVLTLVVAGVACARAPQRPEPTAKMDAALRRLAATGSDTVVGVFIRTTHPVSAAERRRLERAGVRVGTVTGDLLTGRVHLRRVRGVAALTIVKYIELARTLRPQDGSRPGVPSPLSQDGIA